MSLYKSKDGLDDFEEEAFIPEYVYKRGNDAVVNYLFHRNNANSAKELEEIENVEKNLYEAYLDNNGIKDD